MENSEYELYPGKTFGSICQDVVRNSEEKKQQLDILTTDLREMIKSIQDAVMIVPLLREYYDIGVRNDEQLIKLAAIIQRLISGKMSAEGEGGNLLLTDAEKNQLLTSIESTVKVMGEKVPALDVKGINKKSE